MRLRDHRALAAAVQEGAAILPFVVLSSDPRYLVSTPRRRFIRGTLRALDASLPEGRLAVLVGNPAEVIPAFLAANAVEALHAPAVYDPASQAVDRQLVTALRRMGVRWVVHEEGTLFAPGSLLTRGGTPYKVFTPFSSEALRRFEEIEPPLPLPRSLHIPPAVGCRTVEEIPGFGSFDAGAGEAQALRRLREFVGTSLASYGAVRDLPAVPGTSRLSSALARGTLGVRTVLQAVQEARAHAAPAARKHAAIFVRQLLWREFYYHVLAGFPFVLHESFQPSLRRLPWSRSQRVFHAWCEGRTGYPLVDAGMRQLKAEGWMHNRVRMVTASFLTKDLHCDWRKGEAYFLGQLLDADLAANNGGWQWSAGTGTDAAPYFRILNPVAQSKRFDADGDYLRTYLPELARVPARKIHTPWLMSMEEQREAGVRVGVDYPRPIVDHAAQRAATLALYRGGRGE